MNLRYKNKKKSEKSLMRYAALFVLIFGLIVYSAFFTYGADSGADFYSGNSVSNVTLSVPRTMQYNGILKDSGGNPVVDDVYNITFRIFDVSSGGTYLWEQTIPCTTSAGIFMAAFENVDLPFDVDYWLEMEVDSEILNPRQRIAMSAYAASADTVDFALATTGGGWVEDGAVMKLDTASDSVGIGTSAPVEKLHVEGDLFIGGTAVFGPGHSVSGTNNFVAGENHEAAGNSNSIRGGKFNYSDVTAAVIGGGIDNEITGNYGYIGGGNSNAVWGPLGTIGGGFTNSAADSASIIGGSYNTASGIGSVVGGGSADTAGDIGATVLGGNGNNAGADYSLVAGGQNNSAAGWYNTVGGGYNNVAANDNDYITIIGGQGNTSEAFAGVIKGGGGNQSSGNYQTVSGGSANQANGDYGVIGGGRNNSISMSDATVAGGRNNTVTGNDATVSGGYGNTAVGEKSVVAGGLGNISNGTGCVVGGGESNNAAGEYSTIRGGYGNSAGGYCAIGGGAYNSASYDGSTITGGKHNTSLGIYGTVAGGYYNSVESDYGFVAGSQHNLVNSYADYSYLFGLYSEISQDSAFMVHMPYIHFGDEATGYKFPTVDGPSGQIMASDGAGQLNWTDYDTTISGWNTYLNRVYLQDIGDNVGIGTSSPSAKLDVNGTVTTNYIRLPNGAVNYYVFKSNALGAGSWQPPGLFNYQSSGNYIPLFLTSSRVYLTNSVIYQNVNKLGIGTITPENTLTVDGNYGITTTNSSNRRNFQMYDGIGGIIRVYNNSYHIMATFAYNGGEGLCGSVYTGDYLSRPTAYLYTHTGGFGKVTSNLQGSYTNTSFTAPTFNYDNGYIGVFDYNSNPRAAIYVDSLGQGIVAGSIKSFRVPNPDQEGTDIWYACPEGPEAAAYIRGTASLVDGECMIDFPQYFKSVISGEGMSVELTPLSIESRGLAAVELGSRRMVVRELRNGNGSYDFDYLIWAVRKGHENYRVIRPSTDGSPAL